MQMLLRSKKGMVIVCLLVGVWAVMQVSGVRAKPQGGPPPRGGVHTSNAKPQSNPSVLNHKPLSLWGTVIDTNSEISTSCDTEGCSSYTPVFQEQIVCPGGKGQSCAFQITIESENHTGSNDYVNGESGQYQFIVDSNAPSPGPVGIVGYACPNCYEWFFSHTWNEEYIGTSDAVTAIVTNTSYWQKHSVEVDIGCEEENKNSNGCYAGLSVANLKVAVYTPKWTPF